MGTGPLGRGATEANSSSGNSTVGPFSDARHRVPQASSFSMRRILFVDDDADLRDSLKDALEGHAYIVDTARDGAEALALLRTMRELPALILLDVEMPKMNGIEFRKAQLTSPAFAAIPVMWVTATPSLVNEARALGAGALLRKPLGVGALLAAISAVIEGHTAPQPSSP
jgi:DNA-binding response OmpR family regulator